MNLNNLIAVLSVSAAAAATGVTVVVVSTFAAVSTSSLTIDNVADFVEPFTIPPETFPLVDDVDGGGSDDFADDVEVERFGLGLTAGGGPEVDDERRISPAPGAAATDGGAEVVAGSRVL